MPRPRSEAATRAPAETADAVIHEHDELMSGGMAKDDVEVISYVRFTTSTNFAMTTRRAVTIVRQLFEYAEPALPNPCRGYGESST
jgi:hypothetical protein